MFYLRFVLWTGGGGAQPVECLLCKHEALSSNHQKKLKKKKIILLMCIKDLILK
jgi:hypothetical protein